MLFYILLIVIALPLALYYYFKLPKSPAKEFFENILIGHRGCRFKTFPCQENSTEACLYAMERGVQGIEIDIMLSKDSVPVVFHDTNRMTRVCHPVSEVDKATIHKLTVEQIKKYKYNQGPDTARIPTLEELIQTVQSINPNMKWMIETKECTRADVMAKEIVRIFEKYNLYNLAVVGSFNPLALYYVRRIDPRIVTLLLVSKELISGWVSLDAHEDRDAPIDWALLNFLENLPFFKYYVHVFDLLVYWSNLTWVPAILGAGVLGFDRHLIECGDVKVEDWQNKGYAVNVWVVNQENLKKQLLDVGNVAITTDVLFDK